MNRFSDVRQTTTTPVVADFASSRGTPLVIDTAAGIIYYLDSTGAIASISGGGGGGAPTTAEYLVGSANGSLSNEFVVTDTATITWDLTTPGQAKANAIGGGGLSHPQVLARTLGA